VAPCRERGGGKGWKGVEGGDNEIIFVNRSHRTVCTPGPLAVRAQVVCFGERRGKGGGGKGEGPAPNSLWMPLTVFFPAYQRFLVA